MSASPAALPPAGLGLGWVCRRIQCNGRDTDRGVLDKPTPAISIHTSHVHVRDNPTPPGPPSRSHSTHKTHVQTVTREETGNARYLCPYMRDKQHGRGRSFAPPIGPPNNQTQVQGCIIPSSGSCQMQQQQTHIPLRDLLQSAPFQVQKHKR
uniref:Uncharacterized protein n=1 Tax=Aegilops tauschii TaxID=37682 RepID=R7W5M6_AEGTA